MKFLIAYRRFFQVVALAAFLFAITSILTACGVPTWLSDAGNIIALVGSSFTSLASFIAALTGNVALAAGLAAVSTWITKVQSGVTDLEELISQYKASPTTGLLGEIESSLTDLQQNVQQDFSNLGLPASVLSVIAGIASEAESLLVEWGTAIAGVKTATSSAQLHAAVAHISTMADSLPQSIANYKQAVNKILSTPTGDAQTDAALAKTKKL
jgi:hypothetical protein